TMSCPDLGALRASLDASDGAPAAARDHARACPSCSDTLAELQRNAELAAPAVALTAPGDPPASERRRLRLVGTGVPTAAPAAPADASAPASATPTAAAAAQLPRRGRPGRPARVRASTRGIGPAEARH